jgi:hypothetical protein
MTEAALTLYCDPGKTPAESMASELEKLEKAIDDCVNDMRELSPHDLYERLYRLNRLAGYTLGEVAEAVIALEQLHKEKAS